MSILNENNDLIRSYFYRQMHESNKFKNYVHYKSINRLVD